MHSSRMRRDLGLEEMGFAMVAGTLAMATVIAVVNGQPRDEETVTADEPTLESSPIVEDWFLPPPPPRSVTSVTSGTSAASMPAEPTPALEAIVIEGPFPDDSHRRRHREIDLSLEAQGVIYATRAALEQAEMAQQNEASQAAHATERFLGAIAGASSMAEMAAEAEMDKDAAGELAAKKSRSVIRAIRLTPATKP